MSIQFLGMIGHRLSSETIAPVGPIFDRDYIVRFAQTHEAAGFDRLLVGHWSDQPDGFLVTALAGLSTQKIHYLLAHRPGFVSPTSPRANSPPLSTCWGAGWRCISSAAATMPSSAGMAIISTTTSATPAPTPSSTPCARCGPASSRWIFTTIFIRPSRPGPPFARCKNRIFPSTSAARRKRPSPSPANMPTSSLCGASRWRKPERPSSACAPKRRNTSVISASASRSGRLSPTAKPKPGRKPSISCTSPPSRRHSAEGVSKPNRTASAPSGCGPRGAGQGGGQTSVDRHRPTGGRRT
ncbi:putative lavin-dependent oxidoreductase [Klebsiella variicola]|nr:putative lavin-dependent oxidoreductase [Klebsiella variicola]